MISLFGMAFFQAAFFNIPHRLVPVVKTSRHHFSDTALNTPSSCTSVHSLSGLYSFIAAADPGSLFAKISLINFAVLIDDKCHDARLVPMLRISHQRESPRQVAVAHVIHFPAGRSVALPGQNSEIITVKRVRTRAAVPDITLGMSFRHQRPEWAGRFVLRRRPVEAILLSGCALEFQRVVRFPSASGSCWRTAVARSRKPGKRRWRGVRPSRCAG